MILGIDVGGTHTDSVLMQNRKIIRKSKVLTDKHDILGCVMRATQAVTTADDIRQLKRIVLSTTISTNAVAQNQLDPVGLIVMNGPGVSPRDLPLADQTHLIAGYMNHRGIEAEAIDDDELLALKKQFSTDKIDHLAIIGKFSTRNPVHEQEVGAFFADQATHISLGHHQSGVLNFPRRIATTYLNAAIWSLHSRMVDQLAGYLQELGVDVPLFILKADGGTIGVQQSRNYPVQTILSGPAATIMGVLPFVSLTQDSVSIDIGGTTTDIALFADGAPLLEPKGVEIEGHKTLIRGLLTHSMALGGDSHVQVVNGALQIGPERKGSAMAFDGPVPTPTDALIVFGLADIGDKSKAMRAMESLASTLQQTPQQVAKSIVDSMCASIAAKVTQMISEVNSKPVYTIHELLEGKTLHPQQLIAVGGPAPYLAKQVGELLQLPAVVPENSDVINASGAAMARTTVELNLLADTESQQLSFAEDGRKMQISSRATVDDIVAHGQERLLEIARAAGARDEDLEVEVADCQSFNVIHGYATTGKNIRVRLQIKPGLIKHEE
ncbi:hydantoinase/oxoprolinase family protein [Herminiimonas sp.]|uniref:hydantoinase/oxoprolinase family protein n=1 Tax=Herminiimonas sp. TaxID=1926289 RepID=UPI002722225B|nr:hydantoinase/oxoprolinase family protein [Herminiimonas sp.]MDO8306172.1 hydantoinase/oxoprolinase family protein [Herminiimonas sp.]